MQLHFHFSRCCTTLCFISSVNRSPEIQMTLAVGTNIVNLPSNISGRIFEFSIWNILLHFFITESIYVLFKIKQYCIVNYSEFLSSLSLAPQLSWDALVAEGFLCNKAAVMGLEIHTRKKLSAVNIHASILEDMFLRLCQISSWTLLNIHTCHCTNSGKDSQ